MASALEKLQSQLAANPLDESLLRRFGEACLNKGEFALLRAHVEPVLDHVAGREQTEPLAGALASALEASAKQAASGRDAAELYLRAARLHSEVRRRPVDAARALAEAWRSWPDARVTSQVMRLLGNPSIDEAPTFLLSALHQVSDGPLRQEALRRLAAIRLSAREIPQAEALYRELLALVPGDGDATAGLARIDAMRALDTASLEAARRRVKKAPSGVEAVEAWSALGDAEFAAGHGAKAEEAYRSAVLAGEAPHAESRLADLLRTDGRLDDLADLLQRLLEDAPRERQVLIRRRLYRLLSDELGRPEEARAYLISVPADAGADVAALLERAAQHGLKGDWSTAVQVIESGAGSTKDKASKVTLLLEQARILEHELDDVDGAERAFRRIRVAEPRSRETLDFYRRYYAERDEPRRRFANLAQLHAVLPDDDLALRIEVAAEMADVAEKGLDNFDQAVESWRRVLSDRGDDVRAMTELQRLFQEAERWHSLVDHLDSWVRSLPGEAVDQKIELLFEILETYRDPERLPMAEMVTQTYERIVTLSPTNVSALDGLAGSLAEREKWVEFVGVLARKVNVTKDAGELLALFHQIADTYLRRIQSESQAIPVLEHILELQPHDLEVVRKLREIYRRRHDSDQLYRTYRKEVELLEGAQRLDVLVELARLATDPLFRPDEAIAWWREVLEIEPRHEQALAALQTLHADRADWDGYVELLEAKLADAKTRKQKVELLLELGEVVYSRLGDEERARAIFTQIAELSPFNTTARGFLQKLYVTRRAWGELSALYEPRQDWRGYIALLREYAERSEDPYLRADIHVEIARANETHQSDAAATLRHLEQALEAVEDRVDVARMLVARFKRGVSARRKLPALQAIARHSEDIQERREAWRDIARIRAKAKEAEPAFEAWGQAVVTGATLGELDDLGEFVKMADKTGAFKAAVDALSAALGRLPAEATGARIELHRELGHLARARLKDFSTAVSHYRWVLQLAPGDEAALDALEEINLSQNDFEGLEEVFKARANAAPSAAERITPLRRLGELYEDVLADGQQAAAAYQEILAADPGDDEALDALVRVLESEETFGELANALEGLLTRVEDESSRARIQVMLAELYTTRLDQPLAAVDHFSDVIQGAEEAADGAIVEHLEHLFADPRSRAAVAPLLEASYRRSDNPVGMVRALKARLEATDDAATRVVLLDEIATLSDSVLTEPQVAFDCLLERFSLTPAHSGTWTELVRLSGQIDQWDALTAVWRERVDAGTSSSFTEADLNGLRIVLARVYHRELIELEDAIALLEQVIATSDVDQQVNAALRELEVLYKKSADLDNYVRVALLASERTSDSSARRQRIKDAARVLAGALGRPDEAIGHYEGLMAELPSDWEVAEPLTELLQAGQHYERLDALYSRRLEVTSDPARVDELRLRRAIFHRDALGQWGTAADALVDLIASEHQGLGARRALLEMARAEECTPEQRAFTLDALNDHYATRGDREGQLAVLLVKAEFAPAGQARGGFFSAAARVCLPDISQVASDHEAAQNAFDLYSQALFEDPSDREALARMLVISGELGTWEALAEALALCAEQATSAAAAQTLRRHEAETLETRLDDPQGAIAAWRRQLDLADGVADIGLDETLDELDRLYRKTDDHAALLDIIDRKRRAADDPAVDVRLLVDRSQVEHGLGRTRQAIDTLREALAQTRSVRGDVLAAEREEVVTHLDLLLAATGEYGQLIDLLLDSAQETRVVERRRLLTYRAADIAVEQLDSPKRAIAIYQAQLQREPRDEVALDQLMELYRQVEHWEDLADILQQKRLIATEAGALAEEVELLLTEGELLETKLRAVDRAVSAFAAALGRDAANVGALEALERLQSDDNEGPRVRKVLADAYRSTGGASQLATILTRMIASDADVDASARHEELALLYRDTLQQPNAAWEHARSAYSTCTAGAHADERRLLAIAQGVAAGKEPELTALLLGVAGAIGARPQRLARRLADITALSELGVADESLMPFWRAMLADDPGHLPTLDRFEQWARETADSQGMIDALRMRIDIAEDDQAKRAIRSELGPLLSGRDDGLDEAVTVYRAILASAPEHAEAFDALSRLYTKLRRHDDLAELLLAQLALKEGTPAATELRKRLAELYSGELDDAPRAVAMYSRVLDDLSASAPDEGAIAGLEALWGEGRERHSIFRLLEPLYERTENWNKLVALYTSTLELESDAALQAECLSKMARLEMVQLNRPAAAYTTFKALATQLDDPSGHLDNLEALAARLERFEDVAEFYETRIAQGRADAGMMARLAAILGTHLGKTDRAIHFYRFSFERDPARDDVFEALDGLLRRAKRWEELVAHELNAADAARDVAQRTRLLLSAAQVLEVEMAAPRRAVEVLRRLVSEQPHQQDAHEKIVALLDELEDWPTLHQHYRNWLETADSDALATTLRVRLGRSLSRFPETVYEGLDELGEVLDSHPRQRDAIDALIAMVTRAEAVEGSGGELDLTMAAATARGAAALAAALGDGLEGPLEARLIAARLRVLPWGDERQASLTRAAGLLRDQGAADKAFEQYAEALRNALRSAAIEESLERLAADHDLWERLVTLYQECIERDEDAETTAHYFLKIGTVLNDKLGRHSEAIDWYERLLTQQPGNRGALQPLASHYRDSGDASSEARILSSWIELAATEGEEGRLRRRLAALLMDELNDAEAAIAALEGCLPEGTDDKDVVQRLERLYVKTKGFEPLIALYVTALARTYEPAKQLELLAKLSQVYETRQQDYESARDAARRMLSLEPLHGFALTTLDRVERAREDWDAVDEIFALRIKASPAPPQQAKLLVERGELALQQRDAPEEALAYMSQADDIVGPGAGPDMLVKGFEALLATTEVRREAAQRLQRRYKARKAWPSLVNVLMIDQVAATEPEQRVALAVQAAEVAERRLENLGVALRVTLSALKTNPESMKLRRVATDLAERQGDWASIVQTGASVLKEAVDADLITDVALWLGQLQWKRRDDLAGAVATYERVLDVDPLQAKAVSALRELYRLRGDFVALKKLLSKTLEQARGSESESIQVELAGLVAEHESADEAVPMLQELLRTYPDNRSAAQLLRDMLGHESAGEAAASVLESLYRAGGSWKALATMFEARAEALASSSAQGAMWSRAAEVYESELGDKRSALRLLSKALHALPNDGETMRGFQRVAEALGDWEQLAKVLGEVEARITDPAARGDALLHLAQVREARLNQPKEAATALQAALELQPDHHDAIAGLRRIHLTLGELAAYAADTEALAGQETDALRARALWDELYVEAQHAGAAELMVKAAERMWGLDDADETAARRLIHLYQEAGRYGETIELLQTLDERAADPLERARIKLDIANVRDLHLDDADGAIKAFEQAWELDPSLSRAIDRIAGHYRSTQQWDALSRFLEARVERSEAAPERLTLRLELAQLLETRLKDTDGAVATYLDTLEETPDSLDAIDALIQLYGRHRRFDELAGVLERKAELIEDGDAKAAIEVQAAAIHLDQIGDDNAARAILMRLLDRSPDHIEAQLLMARLHKVRDEPEAAARLLDDLAQRVEGRRRIPILIELTKLLGETLDKPEEALPHALEARRIAPDNAIVHQLLPGLLETTGQWTQLAALLEADYQASASSEERARHALALARLHRHQLPDEAKLLEWLARSEEAAPDSVDVASLYVEHYAATGQWEKAAPRLQRLVDDLSARKATDELPPRAHQLGGLMERMGDDDKALTYYRMALDADGTYTPNLVDYGRLLVKQKDWSQALTVHQNLLMQSRKIADKDARDDVLYHLALASHELGQKSRAQQYLKRLFKQAPSHEAGTALKKRMGS